MADNGLTESFFQLLKREQIRPRTCPTCEAARQDVFHDIEMFYNPKRKNTNNGLLSPVDIETRQQELKTAGVEETQDTSHLAVGSALSLLTLSYRYKDISIVLAVGVKQWCAYHKVLEYFRIK